MIQTDSLAQTIDILNEAIFFDRPLSDQDKKQAADFILGRQYPSGPHAGLFAPTDKDFAEGVFLFTGERLHTHLGRRNILSAEAARAILLLELPVIAITEAAGSASPSITLCWRSPRSISPRPLQNCAMPHLRWRDPSNDRLGRKIVSPCGVSISWSASWQSSDTRNPLNPHIQSKIEPEETPVF